jgi:hypothetical protein
MKKVNIIPKSMASVLIRQFAGKGDFCYYLSEDVQFLTSLKKKLEKKNGLKTLSGLFDETLQEIIKPYKDLIAKLNKEHDSLFWWGHHVASKSSTATPLFRNSVYLICCKKLLSENDCDLTFIVDSPALELCIEAIAIANGWKTSVKSNSLVGLWDSFFYKGKDIFVSFRFLVKSLRKKYLTPKSLQLIFGENKIHRKRVVFRSWVTRDTFHHVTSLYSDRNFGCLPDFFRSNGFEVWTMPMFFNLGKSHHEIFKLMGRKGNKFLIPEKHLSLSDYFRVLLNSYKISRKRFHGCQLKGVNIAPLVNEVLERQGVDSSLCELNLCYYFLKRLKENNFKVDTFLYPFENNAPEKLFILGCKEYFPKANLFGFQHSVYLANNMAFHLSHMEANFHPLPDKIVCSGPIYLKLLAKSGFPKKKLAPGQNLRFDSTKQCYNLYDYSEIPKSKKILLSLSYNYDQAFELFLKMKEVLKETMQYEVFIRSHPLLSANKITKFLNQIEFGNYQLAEGGNIQDWLLGMYAFITSGASITTIEAAVMGTPVIRIVFDNSVTYDALACSDYPFSPANSINQIKEQLNLIEVLLENDSKSFKKLGKKISIDYFTAPTEENMKVYL